MGYLDTEIWSFYCKVAACLLKLDTEAFEASMSLGYCCSSGVWCPAKKCRFDWMSNLSDRKRSFDIAKLYLLMPKRIIVWINLIQYSFNFVRAIWLALGSVLFPKVGMRSPLLVSEENLVRGKNKPRERRLVSDLLSRRAIVAIAFTSRWILLLSESHLGQDLLRWQGEWDLNWWWQRLMATGLSKGWEG